MYEALSIAATGLRNQQQRLDTIAHNVANVNSAAYKSVRLDFKDALYTTGITPGPPRTPAPEGNQQKGHGLMIAGIAKDFRPGNHVTTNRELDFALEGEGFFELGDRAGNIVYTRNGNFSLSIEADGIYLTNANGLYVHDENGMNITVPFGANRINVAQDGTMIFMTGDVIHPEATVRLGIYTFRNLHGLDAAGNGNYAETEASGERFPAYQANVRQGVLEGSNVNLAEEMTRLIRTQRVFTLASRALTTADEMEGIANNMRR
jgi:flagellar basal-body rod protein FlgG